MLTGEPQYECVICTRNRPEALRLSIPKILEQTRLPRRVVVVDSSDEPEKVEAVVEDLRKRAPCELTLLRSAPGLTLQRNRGLSLVEAEIVFLPDDDAHYDPDFAEQILKIYERDTEGEIGGVTGMPRTAPRKAELAAAVWQPSIGVRLRHWIRPVRSLIERRLVKDPLMTITLEQNQGWDLPDWLGDLDVKPNCWVRGFRMTFRTQAVREVGFDEVLRDSASFEDVHLGISVGKNQVILEAVRARVFHQQASGGRGSGRARGVTNIANRAYVVARHSPVGCEHRRRVVSFGVYRCFLYGLGGLFSQPHRDAFAGSFAAMRHVRPLLLAPPERAADAYQRLLVKARVGEDQFRPA